MGKFFYPVLGLIMFQSSFAHEFSQYDDLFTQEDIEQRLHVFVKDPEFLQKLQQQVEFVKGDKPAFVFYESAQKQKLVAKVQLLDQLKPLSYPFIPGPLSLLPLSGFQITIDSGHDSSEKHKTISDGKRTLHEYQLNDIVSHLLSLRLERAGAQVSFTRPHSQQKLSIGNRLKNLSNQKHLPHLFLSLHFNIEPWKEEAKEDHFTSENYSMVFQHGSFLKTEITKSYKKFLHHLLTQDFNFSQGLGAQILQQLENRLNVPPATMDQPAAFYLPKYCLPDSCDDGVFYRNLHVLKNAGPIRLLLEPYLYNNTEFFDRTYASWEKLWPRVEMMTSPETPLEQVEALKQELYQELTSQSGHSLLEEVVLSYDQAIKEHFSLKNPHFLAAYLNQETSSAFTIEDIPFFKQVIASSQKGKPLHQIIVQSKNDFPQPYTFIEKSEAIQDLLKIALDQFTYTAEKPAHKNDSDP